MNKDDNRIEELENQIEELKSKLDALSEKQASAEAEEPKADLAEETEEAEEVEEAEEEQEIVDEKETDEKKADKAKASQTKGDMSALFSSETVTAFSAVANSEEMEHGYRVSLSFRMGLSMGILSVLAIALRLLSFNLPFLPSFLNFDFSALPEVIASIAYGPIFGVIIVVVKNLLYIGIKIKSLSIPAVITNIVINSLFVFITGVYYSRKMFPFDPEYQETRDLRRLHIIGGGAVASGIVAIVSFFLAKFVTFPIMFKNYAGYTKEYIIYLYQAALDTLNVMLPAKLQGIITTVGSLEKGIAIYNVPHTFFKYFIITLLAALLYNFLSPILHFRTEMVPEEEEQPQFDFEIDD